MPRGMLLAGCLVLGLCACKHSDGTNAADTNLYGTEDSTGVLPIQPNMAVDLDMPELPIKQAWSQGGKSLTVHRSATCPSDSIEDSGCGNETSYRYVRASRLLKLSSCSCGNERSEEKQLTLTPSQVSEIDQLMNRLEMVTGPQVDCTADDGSIWELIIENPENVEQSFPVALCKSSLRQAGKVNAKSFQSFYEYLRKTLP